VNEELVVIVVSAAAAGYVLLCPILSWMTQTPQKILIAAKISSLPSWATPHTIQKLSSKSVRKFLSHLDSWKKTGQTHTMTLIRFWRRFRFFVDSGFFGVNGSGVN